MKIPTHCKDCGTTDGLGWWVGRYKHPGSAGPRCNACYLSYARQRVANRGFCSDCGSTENMSTSKRCKPCVNRRQRDRWQAANPVRAVPFSGVCDDCGTAFTAKVNPSARFCSKQCKTRAWKRRNGWTPAPPKRSTPKSPASRIYLTSCATCSGLFVGRTANTKRCSDRCRRADTSQRLMGLYRQAIKVRNLTSAKHWHRTLCRYLADRDGGDCAICGTVVVIDITSGPRGEDDGPSVDHIVPRSKGGSDDLANLRLTHWRCNRKRGNRGAAEQLQLIG